MKAIRFNATIPRYALGLALGRFFPSVLWNGISCTAMTDVALPPLPAGAWVRVQTHYGGICGSDMSAIHLHTSPYYSPLTSFPFTLGHENVGTIAEVGPDVSGWEVGERVVVEPLLWCKPRGFGDDLCRYCVQGEINRCQRFTEGILAPGMFIGNCRDTGGSWSRSFVAHQSQLYRVPAGMSDENALMAEPFACGLHAALQTFPRDDETVLVMGMGTIGLCTLAALRTLGSQAEILAVARYPFQAEAARRLGASEVVSAGRGDDTLATIAHHTGARVAKPMVGKQIVMAGGVDVAFACVGNGSALDDTLRLTRPGGRVSLVGVPGITKNVDWSALFVQELDVRAAFTYHHAEEIGGTRQSTFALALNLLAKGDVDLSWMVTHRFRLEAYSRAFRLIDNRRQSGAIKAVFFF